MSLFFGGFPSTMISTYGFGFSRDDVLFSLAQSTVNDSWKNWGAPQPLVGAVSTGGSPVGDGSVGVELDMLLKVWGTICSQRVIPLFMLVKICWSFFCSFYVRYHINRTRLIHTITVNPYLLLLVIFCVVNDALGLKQNKTR